MAIHSPNVGLCTPIGSTHYKIQFNRKKKKEKLSILFDGYHEKTEMYVKLLNTCGTQYKRHAVVHKTVIQFTGTWVVGSLFASTAPKDMSSDSVTQIIAATQKPSVYKSYSFVHITGISVFIVIYFNNKSYTNIYQYAGW